MITWHKYDRNVYHYCIWSQIQPSLSSLMLRGAANIQNVFHCLHSKLVYSLSESPSLRLTWESGIIEEVIDQEEEEKNLSNMIHDPVLLPVWRNMKQLYGESRSERCWISCAGGQQSEMTQQITLEIWCVKNKRKKKRDKYLCTLCVWVCFKK